MRILHISDLHYKKQYQPVKKGYLSIFNSMTSPITNLEKGLKKINLDQISLVLICGDLTEKGSIDDYVQLKMHLDEMFTEIPYIVTLGNHDEKENYRKAWQMDMKDCCELGSVYEFERINIIALDNSTEKNDNGEITTAHCIWLKKQFQNTKYNEKVTVLMMHHPVIYDEHTPIAIVDFTDEFTELIRVYKPDLILCGHTHRGLISEFENVLYATCGSLSFRGTNLEDGSIRFCEDAVMNLINIEDNKISIREINILKENKVLGTIWI